jgi:hypothetical protein
MMAGISEALRPLNMLVKKSYAKCLSALKNLM